MDRREFVRDFCFSKNKSSHVSLFIFFFFFITFSHTYHDFDYLINLPFRELLWCNSLIYCICKLICCIWYRNHKNNERPSQEEQLWRMLHFLYHLYSRFLLHYPFGNLRNRVWVSISICFSFLLNGYIYQREFVLSSLSSVLHRNYSIFLFARHLFYGFLLLTRTNEHRRE